jgi:hypothetical protein
MTLISKQELESQAVWLKSEIIRREYSVEHANQELEDLHRRLEEIQISICEKQNEEELGEIGC